MTPVRKTTTAAIAIGIVHFSGFIGMQTAYEHWFVSLTPLSLALSFVLLVWCQENPKALILVLIFAGSVGYVAEIIGVKTGKVFGSYYYGNALGVKLFEVPLMIAVNWAMLSLAAANVVAHLKSIWLKVLAAACLMVLLDLLIEPVAPVLDFWHWTNGAPGIHNFVGWFIISCFVQIPFHLNRKTKGNKMGFWLLIIQALFFILFLLTGKC